MQKLMFWSCRHSKLVVILLLGMTLLFGYFVPAITVDVSIQTLWTKGDPARQRYDDTVKAFGSDKITVVFVKDRRLFAPEMLTRLNDFHTALDNLPNVTRVDSLFSVFNLKGKEGSLHLGPFIEKVPKTPDEARAVKADALGNPMAVDNLVSDDGTAMTFNLFLDEDTGPDDETIFSIQVDELVATLSPHVEDVFQLGTPHTTRMCYEGTLSDQRTVVPLAFFLSCLVTFVLWRSASLLGLIMITSALSIVWTLGFMGLSGIPMNLFTAIIPALLIVVGSTEDIHLFSEYQAGLRETGTRTGAVSHMIRESGFALFLTSLTTFLGFLAISLNKIVILKQFGLVSAFGLLANPVVTFLAAPAYFKWFGPKQTGTGAGFGFVNTLFDGLTQKIIMLVRGYKRQTFGALTGGILVVGLFSFNIKVDNDFVGTFKPSSPIRVFSQKLHEEMAGIQTFFIHIKSGTANTFNQPEHLARIADIQAFLGQRDWCDLTTSVVDYLRLICREMRAGDTARERIPDSPAVIAQYLFVLPSDEVARFITRNAGEVSIVVRHNESSSNGLKKIVKEASDIVEQNLDPRFDYRITGESIISMAAADTLSAGQVISLGLTLLVVFALMSVLFANVKAGALGAFTTILPIIFLCGLMGASGIFLNTGTSMVAVIAIGIAVDDTVHFLTRYYKEMRRLKDKNKAVEATVLHEIRPIVATSLGLASGFGVIMLSDMLPLVHFGFLAVLTMLCALVVDLLITPILLVFMPLTAFSGKL